MNKNNKTFLLILVFFLLFSFNPVLALDLETPEELLGLDIEKIEKAPGAFGLFWRGVKENASLAFTFDSLKKAAKRLKYAEERMKIAEILLEEADDPKIQARLEKVVDKANKFIIKLSENEDKIMEKMDGKKEKLLENIAKHRLNREKILEKIEDRVPVERLEKFQEKREEVEEKSSQFFEKAIKNKEVPERLKEALKERSRYLRVILTNRTRSRKEIKELLKRIESGDENARKRLMEMRETKE